MTAVHDRTSMDRIIHEQADALAGFTVLASDGEAGTVAPDQGRVDDEHLLVHVGGRIFGKDVVVETSVISAIDAREQEVHVDRIVDWVQSSPKLKDLARR